MTAAATAPGLKPSARVVFELLRERPAGVTSLDALDGGAGFRLSGRILELRQAGFAIETTWETTGRGARIARYRLLETEQLAMALA